MTQEHECARDAALVQRICMGEKALFHELIAPYRRVLFAAAYAVLRNPEDAEEAVQEAALKAFLHLQDLKEPARFKPWLLRIVVNEARMHRRHGRPDLFEPIAADDERDGDFYPRQFADWHDLPDEALEREELRQAVRDAVNKLPAASREVYLLADAGNLSNAAIAEMLGVSISVVKTRLHRARLRVQEQLRPAFQSRFSDHIHLMKGMNPWSRAGK
jgi:RNA polymerase sigma-70 factor (ECF subfamily)